MNKTIKVLIAIAVIALLIWLIYKWSGSKSKKQNSKSWQSNQVISAPPETEIQKQQEEDLSGQTIANVDYGVDYKKSTNNYYLSFTGGTSEAQIEQITKQQYDKFMSDHPSGVTMGNVLKKYQ